MKSFFSLYTDSFKELKKISTITVTGMLMAVSIVLRSYLNITISNDLRVNFAFLGLFAIAALYGPSVTVLAAAGVDIIGYILDGAKMREYSVPLLMVKLIMAAIYGAILYRRLFGKVKLSKKLEELLPDIVVNNIELAVRGIIARIAEVLVGNIVLNSIVLYKSYINSNFPMMSDGEWSAFWVWMTPRLAKNFGMLPFECAAIIFVLPAVYVAYTMVFGRKDRMKKVAAE